MKPEVTVTDDEITVTYPDGMSWVWKRRVDGFPEHPACAAVTCEEHEHRFRRAWNRMVDVKRADKGLPPWKSDPKAALTGQALEAAVEAPLPGRKAKGSRGARARARVDARGRIRACPRARR